MFLRQRWWARDRVRLMASLHLFSKKKKGTQIYEWLCKYILRFLIFNESRPLKKMKETKHLWQNQKRTAFPCTHPQAHGSIFFHFCMSWRTFVYGRRSNAEADLSFSLHVHTDTVRLFLTLQSSFVPPPPHNDVIFIMLFIFFLNKSSVKKKGSCKILFYVCLNIWVKDFMCPALWWHFMV